MENNFVSVKLSINGRSYEQRLSMEQFSEADNVLSTAASESLKKSLLFYLYNKALMEVYE